jgi:hypothetical protein
MFSLRYSRPFVVQDSARLALPNCPVYSRPLAVKEFGLFLTNRCLFFEFLCGLLFKDSVFAASGLNEIAIAQLALQVSVIDWSHD